MSKEVREVMKALSITCYVSATLAIAYAALTEQRWPLWFVGFMVAISVIVGAARMLEEERE